MRAFKKNLPAERLREVLSYDPLTGIFKWRVATSSRVRVGDVAGGTNKEGYRVIGVDGTQYLAHRLAWIYVTGRQPNLCLDHKDGNRSNNRFDNLREASASENTANSRCSRLNVSGLKRAHRIRDGWKSEIRIAGRAFYLGRFDSAESAHAALPPPSNITASLPAMDQESSRRCKHYRHSQNRRSPAMLQTSWARPKIGQFDMSFMATVLADCKHNRSIFLVLR
jgi:hypothetical protein